MTDNAAGVLKRTLARLAASAKPHEAADREAAELRKDATSSACTPINQLRPRERVAVTGTLRSVTLRPRAGVPALVGDLYDGSGSISLVWLGRRQIAGIETGRRLTCYGRVAHDHDQPVIFNPRYELRAAGSE